MIIAYVQWTLVVVALILLIRDKFQYQMVANSWLVIFTTSILMALPFGPIQAYGYFWGVFGQISITSTFLLFCYVLTCFSTAKIPVIQFERSYIFGLIAILGLVFYPLALGFSPVDPYGWGFGSLFLTIVFLFITIALWVFNQRILAWLGLCVVASHQIGLLESDNLWDYLFDPFLVSFSFWWGVQRMKEYFRIRLNN